MSTKAKHIETSDILGILIPLGMSIFTYLATHNAFFVYYLGVSLFRLVIMLLQITLIRSKDTPERKFIKERRLCRLVGLSFVVVIIVYSYMLLWFAAGLKSQFFTNYPWTIVVYVVYALYKLISGIYYLKKSRRCWSPYREIIANLSFMDAMGASLNAVSLTFVVTSFLSKTSENRILYLLIILIILVSLGLGFKMIKSRKLPNLIK